MDESRSTIIIGFVFAYFLLCIGVGLWAMRRTKSTHDFFIAGQSLGVFVTAIAVMSSTMSGFGFVGGPGMVYSMGSTSFWMIICVTLSYPLAFFLLAKRLRLMAELRNAVSLPDVVVARYKSPAAGGLTALAIFLGVIGYMSAQVAAMATVLQILLADFVSLSLLTCALISTALLVFYCVTGGIIASVYTDLVQGGIMLVAALLVFLAAYNAVDGGFAEMSETIMKDDPGAMSPWGTKGMLGCLSFYFVFALGLAGQPHIVTKFMMNRSVADARWSLPITVIGFVVTALLWIGIGMAMRALVLQGEHATLSAADQAAPEFLKNYASPVLAGVVFAGLFAAIMSTVDAFLNIGAAAVVHDIPKAFGKTVKSELLWARVATVAIALLAMVFGLYGGELVGLLAAFGWGTFAAALVPVVGIGLNWKRATSIAACVAIAVSLSVNFSIKVFAVPMPFGIDPGAVALLVSLILFIGISLCSRPVPIDPDIEEVMEL
jgi:SSS family transporter